MNIGQDRQIQMVGCNGGNQFRQGMGHLARNCIVRPRRRDAAYLQTQLLIAQKEEAGIQLQAEEFDLMAAAGDLDEIKEVNANCILMANLQQASTSDFSVEQYGGTVEQNPATVEETCAYFESLYNNLAIEVKKVNMVNHKMKETNVDLTTELARYKNQEKYFEINQEKYDKLERCYLKSVYQEKFLTKKINALHLSSAKTITTLNEEIENLNNQLSKEKSNISSLQEEKKRLKSDLKIREYELLEKQIQLKNKIKELDNILSLANKADESLAKHKALEFEIERLLRAVVSHDIMFIVQNLTVVDTSDLQTELEHIKEQFENCIIKKENEYAKLWNDWYKKCEECKYEKISYDKAYNAMKQKIEQFQAQLGDQKGKSKDTPCVSDTLDPLSHKLENKNVELEFEVLNYAKENAHLKTTYKNLFDSINVTRTQTKSIIDSLQEKLHNTINENAKLRARLFDKVFEQKNTTKGTSMDTKFSKQSILGKPPSSSGPKLYSVTPFPNSKVISKVGEMNALSKPVTSNSAPLTRESKVMNSDRVIAPGMFWINPFKTYMEKQSMPNKLAKASNDKSEFVCAMCNQRLITFNHDVCVLIYVNDMNSRVNNFNANVLNTVNKKKHKPKVKKTKKVGSKERIASPKPSKPRSCLRNQQSDSFQIPLLFLAGTVRFGNDHVAAILGYGDLQWGNIFITTVYFVEGLRYNLFSVRQFYDSDLEVAF
ncbi:hypothetical protein Tco_1267958 [Tanacetum coccineum]